MGAGEWSDAAWQPPPLAGGLIYELHVGTFTPAGTFDAALARLDHLAALGVTHVELMPVAEFPGERGWGYDPVAPFAPHHAYGEPRALARFVDACHARGLAVLLDVVLNHVGPGGEGLQRFGPYLRRAQGTPWGPGFDLDGPDSAEVRRFLVDAALAWLRDYHMDGLRLDAVDALSDASRVHLLAQLAGEVRALAARLGRPLLLVAETSANDPRLVIPPEGGGYGLDAQWNDDFQHASHALLSGERAGCYADFGTLGDLAKCLRDTFVLDGRYSAYRKRRHGRSAAGLPRHRFVACLQNHDSLGNRPHGERSASRLSPGRLKIGAALLLTSPFVPLLFQGEEWGATTPFPYFCDHRDPGLARAVRAGRSRELARLGWRPDDALDPLSTETFRRAKLDWAELGKEPHAALLEWYRSLVRLRQERQADPRGHHLTVECSDGERWLALEREWCSLRCNLGAAPRRLPVREGSRLLLASDAAVRLVPGGVDLPAESVALLGR